MVAWHWNGKSKGVRAESTQRKGDDLMTAQKTKPTEARKTVRIMLNLNKFKIYKGQAASLRQLTLDRVNETSSRKIGLHFVMNLKIEEGLLEEGWKTSEFPVHILADACTSCATQSEARWLVFKDGWVF